ncbi:MAG: hypothetical protein JO210_14195, partial [Acidobacteriaceae bacterium]|nr:hypothetical protein [Acidobacteriaceae bacterium]
MRRRVAVLATVCTALVSAEDILAQNVSVQNQDCAGCHPAETRLHERTRMAHAMVPAMDSAFGENLPDRPLRESGDGYEFHFGRTLAGLSITAERGTDTREGVIEWVLGAGAQGQTPLVRTQNGILESRISYFPQLHQYGITIGQDAGASPNAIAALGRRQSLRDLQMCIGCHATAISRDLEPVVPGVQCQRCHPGADEHAKGHGKPLNPGKLMAVEQVRLCGNCHRTKPPVDDNQLENIRFQPLRLMKSRCFASEKLACTTCHVAHQDARRNDPEFYNGKCNACHASRAHSDER